MFAYTPNGVVTKAILLIAIAAAATSMSAQVPMQSLLYRYQAMQYQELVQNARPRYILRTNYVPTSRIDFPLTCPPNKEIQNLWRDGEGFYSKMKWNESLTIYEACVRGDSLFCDAYLRLAQSQVNLGRLAEAWSTLQLAERKFPRNAIVYLGLGQLSLMLNYPAKALSYFERMDELFPDNLEYYLSASFALYQVNELDKALHYLERAQKKIPALKPWDATTVDGKANLAYSSSSRGRHWDYLIIYEGILHYKLHHNKKALGLLKGVGTHTEDPDLEGTKHYFLGLCYLNKGENMLQKAREHLRTATKMGIMIEQTLLDSAGLNIIPAQLTQLILKDYYPDRHTHGQLNKPLRELIVKGERNFENHDYETALRQFWQIVSKDSSVAEVYLRIAETQGRLNLHAEELQTLKYTYVRFPKNVTVGLRLAREQVRLKAWNDALNTYMNILSHQPHLWQAYVGATTVMTTVGKNREAVDMIIALERKMPLPIELTMMKGILFYQLGLKFVALQYLAQVQKASNNPVATYYAALCFNDFGTKYAYVATDNMNLAMELGAIVYAETLQKLGMDPSLHPTATQPTNAIDQKKPNN